MMLYQPGRTIAPGEVRARLHANGEFAMIDLGGAGASVFVNTTDEADALIAAACEAKRLLLAKRAPAEWCPAYTGPDEELDVAVYCDRQAGHPGNHHGAGGDGSEIAWPSEPVSPEAAEQLYDAIVAGTPVLVDDEQPKVCSSGLQHLGNGVALKCELDAGHDGAHSRMPVRPVFEVVHADAAATE